MKLIFDDVSIINAILGKERVFDGIFISTFATKKIRLFFSFSYELLAATQSIVIGFFGLSITMFMHKIFYDKLLPFLLISSTSLAILIMPYMVEITKNALDSIQKQIKNSALNLGASKQQNLFLVQLPYASKYLLSGNISNRKGCRGYSCYNDDRSCCMAGIPSSIFQKYEALPFYIYYISSEHQDITELNKGYSAAVVLLFISIILFITASILRKTTSQLLAGQVELERALIIHSQSNNKRR